MTQHAHSTFVEGCYRCDLSRDETQCRLPSSRPDLWLPCDRPLDHSGPCLHSPNPDYERRVLGTEGNNT